MEEFIKSENLYFSYSDQMSQNGGTVVLDNVSLNFSKGEFAAVLGHNGSGKSTFAKCLNGINLPTGGKVTVNGLDTAIDDNLMEIRKNVGMVFQNPDNQIVSSIVEDDVAFALENLGVDPEEMRERVDNALNAVGMYEYRMHSPSKLSGGQKQRVAIAGILAMNPQCVVLDEPTAMLDPQGRKEVMSTLKKLNSQGVTVVLITHYMEEAAMANRVVVIDSGRVIMDDEPKKVFCQVEKLKSLGLDVPQATQICFELRKRGCNIPQDIIFPEECAAELKKLIAKGRRKL